MEFIASPTRRSAADAKPLSKVCWPGSRSFLSMPLPPVSMLGLSAELAAKGAAVGPHDLIIAATALAKGYIVTTRDEREA
jgi:hypothetical protein